MSNMHLQPEDRENLPTDAYELSELLLSWLSGSEIQYDLPQDRAPPNLPHEGIWGLDSIGTYAHEGELAIRSLSELEGTFLGGTDPGPIDNVGKLINNALRSGQISHRNLVQGHIRLLAKILKTQTKAGVTVHSLEDLPHAELPDAVVTVHVAIKLVLLDSDTGKLRLQEICKKLEEKWPGWLTKQNSKYNTVRNILSRNMMFQQDKGDKCWRLDFAEDPVAMRYKNKARNKLRMRETVSLPQPIKRSKTTGVAESTAIHSPKSGDVQGVQEGSNSPQCTLHAHQQNITPPHHHDQPGPPQFLGAATTPWTPSGALPTGNCDTGSLPTQEFNFDTFAPYVGSLDGLDLGGGGMGGITAGEWLNEGLYNELQDPYRYQDDLAAIFQQYPSHF